MRPTRALLLSLSLCAFLPGCSLFPSSSSDGGGSSGGGEDAGPATPNDSPTVNVTVNGVHFGPAPPTAASSARLSVTRDASGQVTGSSFRLDAANDMAGCSLAFDTYGSPLPIGAGQYQVRAATGSATADGTVTPLGGERISTPAGGAGCNGSDCDGAILVLQTVDAAHIGGYFSGSVVADGNRGVASVVCAFFVPAAP